MERYLYAETERIQKDKWLEGEKLGHDPGDDYVSKWIAKNAVAFREKWEYSVCKNCLNICAYEVRSFCSNYIEAAKNGNNQSD